MSNEKVAATFHQAEPRKEIHPDWMQRPSNGRAVKGVIAALLFLGMIVTLCVYALVVGHRNAECQKAIQTADAIIALDNDTLQISADAFQALGDVDFSRMATLRTEMAKNVDRVHQLRSDYSTEKEACQ